ncbi:hypothetical protein KFL_001070170 [Klebsormidium nitens]|uniref:Dehydrin n=1 Tax=Klebsormidium nitens TaxID=105231 RepID=A0A1Y1HZF3_KLENI|nr:hypothetical protein KFL_001070170 [Klebsormidium nitens]|eukprot:GAQ82311.1 hypothetical protein KFL_001070170 [Klebsormidium nitens]
MSQTYGGDPSEGARASGEYGSGAGRSDLPQEFESKVHIAHQTPPVNLTLERPEVGGSGQTNREEEEGREQGEERPLFGKKDSTGETARPVLVEAEEVAYEVVDKPVPRAQAAAGAVAPVVVEEYAAEVNVVSVVPVPPGTVLIPGPTVVGGTVVPEKDLKKSSSSSSSSSSEGEEEHAAGVAAPGEKTPPGEKPKKKKNIFKRIEEKVKETLTGHHHGSDTGQK